MVLYVAHGVQEQLGEGEFPRRERAAAPRAVVGKRFHLYMALFPAMRHIGPELLLGIPPLG